jgi:hypothetical protein
MTMLNFWIILDTYFDTWYQEMLKRGHYSIVLDRIQAFIYKRRYRAEMRRR